MEAQVDLVLNNGRGTGPVANELLSMGSKTDIGIMRPWVKQRFL